jgi:hypothetical protein
MGHTLSHGCPQRDQQKLNFLEVDRGAPTPIRRKARDSIRVMRNGVKPLPAAAENPPINNIY